MNRSVAVNDRVIAIVPSGDQNVDLVEGFVTGIERDGKLIAVRPAAPDEWEDASPSNDDDAVSFWWDSLNVFHADDVDAAFDRRQRMLAGAEGFGL